MSLFDTAIWVKPLMNMILIAFFFYFRYYQNIRWWRHRTWKRGSSGLAQVYTHRKIMQWRAEGCNLSVREMYLSIYTTFSRAKNTSFNWYLGQRPKCLKNQACDVIKMSDYPSLFRGFLSHFPSHLPNFYDVTYLILRHFVPLRFICLKSKYLNQ